MAYKKKWIKTSELPENVRKMADAFEAAFGNGLHNQVISHWRDDALFIQCYGMLNAYSVARFCQQNPDIYIEIQAIAPSYFDIRLFDSDWMVENEVTRMHKWMNAKPCLPAKHPYSVRARA